jgi:hypothetical protein
MMPKIKRRAPRPLEQDRGGYLEQEIADKEHARGETKDGGRKSEVLVHGERCEAYIRPVNKIHDVKQHHERDQPPCASREDLVLFGQLPPSPAQRIKPGTSFGCTSQPGRITKLSSLFGEFGDERVTFVRFEPDEEPETILPAAVRGQQ